ncbi:hypothetical protein [Paenibacillus terrae]|uniref:hypothetical protein n=1 Tax=Paenibacillus terrae TaxID=159743 RepID=UPI001656826F|nr:hypothetical protein [Paenibacillus terrae]
MSIALGITSLPKVSKFLVIFTAIIQYSPIKKIKSNKIIVFIFVPKDGIVMDRQNIKLYYTFPNYNFY